MIFKFTRHSYYFIQRKGNKEENIGKASLSDSITVHFNALISSNLRALKEFFNFQL